MIRVSFISMIFLLMFSSGRASYNFNPTCQQAMQQIFNLQTVSARSLLEKEIKIHPENYYLLYLEQLSYAIELILLDEEKLFDEFVDRHEAYREIMDDKDTDSPYYRLVESQMIMYLGLATVKFGSKIKGVSRVVSSYNILKDNLSEFPDFWQDDQMEGLYYMAFANIPPVIRWAARMLGLKGDMEKGFRQLQAYQRKAMGYPGLAEESILLLNIAYKMKWQEDEGFRFLAGLDPAYHRITLIGYFYANLAYFSARNDLALEILDRIDRSKIEVKFYGMDYLIGRCMLNRLDPDAGTYLKSYLNGFPGIDYKKDACNRLSWNCLVHGDMEGFRKYRAEVERVGSDLRDRDREAIAESSCGYDPLPGLLKARLLCDGGYNKRSWEELDALRPADLEYLPYQLEYHYRRGRLFQADSKYDMAVDELLMVIHNGSEAPYTFATRAALQLGSIYEERGDYRKAYDYYDLCLDLYDSDHTAEGVENRAEVGRDRVSEKL